MPEEFSTLKTNIEYDIKYKAPSGPMQPIYTKKVSGPLDLHEVNEVDNDLLVFQFYITPADIGPGEPAQKPASWIQISLWRAKEGFELRDINPPPLASTTGGWITSTTGTWNTRAEREDTDLYKLYIEPHFDPVPILPDNHKKNRELILKEGNFLGHVDGPGCNDDNWNQGYIPYSNLPNGFPGWGYIGCHSHRGGPIRVPADPSGCSEYYPYKSPTILRVSTRIASVEPVMFLVLLEIQRRSRLKLTAYPVIVRCTILDAALKKCFIATAAFGSPMAQEIDVLRNWRDHTVGKTSFGQRLIELYYSLSPPFAKIIARSEKMRKITRGFLKPLVDFLSKRYPRT